MSKELAVALEKVTPSMAKKYLDLNTRNRPLRPARVTSYADQMRNGQWRNVGDPIRFDVDGVLMDGQHRLAAVVQSGVTQNFYVIRNLPKESFVVLDTGLGRTAGDALGFNVGASSHKAAVIRLLYVIECGGDPRLSNDRNAVTRTDIHDYYKEHTAEIDEMINLGSSLYKALPSSNRTAWGVFNVLASRVSPDHHIAFVEAVRSGAALEMGDARLALRNWLTGRKPGDLSVDQLAIYTRAWNAWMREEPRTLLRPVKSDEDYPVLVAPKKKRK